MLMRLFQQPPDRLDGIDLPRVLRALDARHILRVGEDLQSWNMQEIARTLEGDAPDRDLLVEIVNARATAQTTTNRRGSG